MGNLCIQVSPGPRACARYLPAVPHHGRACIPEATRRGVKTPNSLPYGVGGCPLAVSVRLRLRPPSTAFSAPEETKSK